jgi:hypothetical protein
VAIIAALAVTAMLTLAANEEQEPTPPPQYPPLNLACGI